MMGTREVYEEKLRSGNLYHDPTINPGLGSPRCPRCLSLLNPNSQKGEWPITYVLHDATAVAGSGIGGMLSAVHGFNTVTSLASGFRCKCSIWRLCPPKVCSAHRNIILCRL
ncbi:GTP-binding protein like [Quillaja saponaria]|uniref:GTP-binding protein like n=1 Tax=Quillaja saponaria TaxID=32244 RepID=A0AAD7PYC2_QUISA|nr:GTP-binding protein like [Quillaja saponaria]KAJ7971413.1 GTP-binding protein like [Quillaja saponaria]